MAAINKRKLLESAQKNLQKGALDKALKDYQELLAADPRDANVRLKVGDLQLKRGNADDAIAAYLKVADQFMRDGFDAKAVAIYKQVTKIDGKRFDVYIPLADLYQRIGLTSDAMAALQTAAEAYQRDGRRREALDLLRRMASLDPTNTASRLKVAELLHQESLTEEAVAEFGEAAAELERQGDWEARATVLQRLIEIAPTRIEGYDALVALWIERGNASRAEPIARKLVEIDPERAESLQSLAGIVAERGDSSEAVELYRRAAESWLARGEDVRAREILQRHVPSEPFDMAGDRPVAAGAVTNPVVESPFGEEGIGGEPPPARDEFRFVDEPAPTPAAAAPLASGDVDFELELDDSPPEPQPEAAPAPGARTVVREVSAPALAAPTPIGVDAPAAADPDQLLAEAAVYLRYGKHERAVASLTALLEQEPHHLGALEQLGEAHLRGDAQALAVEAWTRAVTIATGAGDAERAGSLRGRIEAIDAAAAASLPEVAAAPPMDEPTGAIAGDATPVPGAFSDEAASDDAGADEEFEIDLDGDAFASDDATPEGDDASAATADVAAAPVTEPSFGDDDVEVDIDAAAFDAAPAPEATDETSAPRPEALANVEAPAAVADSTEAPADELDADPEHELEEIEIEVADSPAVPVPVSIEAEVPDSSEIAADAIAGSDGADPTELATDPDAGDDIVEDAAEPAISEPPAALADATAPAPLEAASVAPADAADLSGTTTQQITEDLEEASFYFEQGLFDEAEAIYQRIVQRAPNHPGALLRLGEIAVARGDDPSRLEDAVSEFRASPGTSDAEEDAAEDGPTIEPPDDLDLTAREFGPERAWEDDDDAATEDPVADEASQVSLRDTTLDRTDPSEWTTPDTSASEVATESASVVDDEVEAAFATSQAPVETGTTEAAGAVASERAAVETPISEPPSEPVAETPPLELTAPEIAAEEDGGAPAFDLAAELSEALRDEPAEPARRGSTDEDGFAALFSEFKRGVSRTLDEGDVETHFDLGIAYREMGLLEDAIGEFRYALGSSTRRLDALHMMGLCALDVGRSADAVGHLEQALASPEVPHERETALRFDLGRAYEIHADLGRAIEAFARVVELDAGFQDAAQRLETLRTAVESGEAPAAEAEVTEDEAYESFDDLLAQTAEASPEAAPVETYESFEEFQGDEPEPEPEPIAVAEEIAADAEAADAVQADATADAAAVEPAPEPVPEPAPEPIEAPRKRRKLSFF